MLESLGKDSAGRPVRIQDGGHLVAGLQERSAVPDCVREWVNSPSLKVLAVFILMAAPLGSPCPLVSRLSTLCTCQGRGNLDTWASWWYGAWLWYLQCVSNGDTTALHYSTLCTCQGRGNLDTWASWWYRAWLWYLQCVSNGDTTALHNSTLYSYKGRGKAGNHRFLMA